MFALGFNFCYTNFKKNKNIGLIIALVLGSCLKALFMTCFISMLLLPNMLPENLLPKLDVFEAMFSVTQLHTALIGSFYVYIIWNIYKKVYKNREGI